MPARCCLARKEAGALEHEIHTEIFPRQLRRIALGAHADAIAVHDEIAAFDADLAWKLAVHAVVAREMRVGLRVAEIVQRDELNIVLLAVLVVRPQDVPPDAPVTVDCHFDRHYRISEAVGTTFTAKAR